MDTRQKLRSRNEVAALLQNGDWTVIVGLFDPLTVAQAQRISAAAETGRKIFAVVLPDRETLLPAEARAALVAGLRDVAAVVIADPAQISTGNSPIDRDDAAELNRSSEFVDFVLKRQKAAAAPAASQEQ